MLKRGLLIAVCACGLGLGASAQQVLKGEAVHEISTASPTEVISIMTRRDMTFSDGTTVKKNSRITGKMLDVKSPEKWHHNATFTFIPETYTEEDGTVHNFNGEVKGTYRQKMKPDYKHSEIAIGDFMFSPSYISNTKEIIHGNGKQVFDDYCNRSTPWGKGTEITIKAGEVLYFNFE